MNLLIVVQVVGNECWSCWFSSLMMVLPNSFSKEITSKNLVSIFHSFYESSIARKNSVVFYVRAIFSIIIKRHDATNLDVQQIENKWSIMMIQNKYKNITVSVDQEG